MTAPAAPAPKPEPPETRFVVSIIPAPYREGGARGWCVSCPLCASWEEFLYKGATREPRWDAYDWGVDHAEVKHGQEPVR